MALLQCDGDQFDVLGDDDSLIESAFTYYKIVFIEGALVYFSMFFTPTKAQKIDDIKVAAVFLSLVYNSLLLSRTMVNYFVLYGEEYDYFCDGVGLFSYKTLWLVGGFLITTMEAHMMNEENPRPVLKAGLVIAAAAAALIAVAFLVTLPVLLLFLGLTVLVVAYIPLLIWIAIQIAPFVLLLGGFATYVALKLGMIQFNWRRYQDLERTEKLKAWQSFGTLLFFPHAIFYMFGYLAVKGAYEHFPSNVFMRLLTFDSVVFADLQLASAVEIFEPNMVSLALARLIPSFGIVISMCAQMLRTGSDSAAKPRSDTGL